MNKVSKCCKVKAVVKSDQSEGTNYYECTKCHQPCDVDVVYGSPRKNNEDNRGYIPAEPQHRIKLTSKISAVGLYDGNTHGDSCRNIVRGCEAEANRQHIAIVKQIFKELDKVVKGTSIEFIKSKYCEEK